MANLVGVCGTSTLVFGGVRSGKSAFAETSLQASLAEPQHAKLYIATAEPFDSEMTERISHHQQRRGEDWHLKEAPIELPQAILEAKMPFLVDCLSVWLGNLMHHEPEHIEDRMAELIDAICATSASGITGVYVSLEAGLGLLPMQSGGRRFLDHLGDLNQSLAQHVERVVWVAAGLPTVLKPVESRG